VKNNTCSIDEYIYGKKRVKFNSTNVAISQYADLVISIASYFFFQSFFSDILFYNVSNFNVK